MGDAYPAAIPQRRPEYFMSGELVSVVRGTATDQDFGVDDCWVLLEKPDGEESGHAGAGVVAGAAGENWVLFDDLVGPWIEEYGTVVGEDKDVAVGGEIDKWIEVVLGFVGGFLKKFGLEDFCVLGSLRRNELVAHGGASTNDDKGTVS